MANTATSFLSGLEGGFEFGYSAKPNPRTPGSKLGLDWVWKVWEPDHVQSSDGDCGNFLNLFLQGMELVMDITSEVKFFKVKIDELVADLKVGFLRELVGETDEEESGDDS